MSEVLPSDDAASDTTDHIVGLIAQSADGWWIKRCQALGNLASHHQPLNRHRLREKAVEEKRQVRSPALPSHDEGKPPGLTRPLVCAFLIQKKSVHQFIAKRAVDQSSLRTKKGGAHYSLPLSWSPTPCVAEFSVCFLGYTRA